MAPSDQLDEQRRLLSAAIQRAGLTVEQLWTRYFALGGEAGLTEVEAYLHRLMPLPTVQCDLLAQAVNERLDELVWSRRVPYSRIARQTTPDPGPLAALVELLEGAHLAPPERLPAVAAAAGRALDVDLMIYLVNYEQSTLVPVPPEGVTDCVPLGVDTTLAGRAFRLVEIIPAEGGDRPRLWVPLLDGVERLGVLDVVLPARTDLHDPGLRKQCRWLSALLGHLVTSTMQYGDALDVRRRSKPRSASAELIWQLLPPLTAGTDTFVLAGLLEPAYSVGGDAFDYSLSETTASLAVFDAIGHSLSAGLMAAAALAAYRGARREGQGLFGQTRAIDQTIAGQFGSSQFVTGVLAELDLLTGRLRYVIAGHPRPLVLRSGRIVRTLTEGRRLPFGLDSAELTVAEEALQPDDWLVLYTDGITEARDAAGEYFGDVRLVDFLEREAAAAHPPPETVRRLVQAVMAHQNGVLQDDATVLLARWTKRDELSVDRPSTRRDG